MEFEPRDHFKEKADPTVLSFNIIETDTDRGYRIAEKWNPTDDEPKWQSYWLPVEELQRRLSDDKCEYVAKLSEDQFERLCEKVDSRILTESVA